MREQDEPNVGLVVPILNVLAYLLGAVTLALPPWVGVTVTVAAVLLLTGREQLHRLARRVEIKEIVTAGEFLILTGIALPLLPNHPVTTLTDITPRQVWLALVVVCSFSYASYLAQRYWAAAAKGLWMAALGGLYSSTATTVVLARQAQSRSGAQAAGASRHHACDRDHVFAHPRRCRDLQYPAGAHSGAAACRAVARRLLDFLVAISGGRASAGHAGAKRDKALRQAAIRSNSAPPRSLPRCLSRCRSSPPWRKRNSASPASMGWLPLSA